MKKYQVVYKDNTNDDKAKSFNHIGYNPITVLSYFNREFPNTVFIAMYDIEEVAKATDIHAGIEISIEDHKIDEIEKNWKAFN